MEFLKKIIFIPIIAFSLISLDAVEWKETGHILYLISQGKEQQAINIYKERSAETGEHDYELLHRIGLALLEQGFKQRDPEVRLMTIFGASISAHDDAYYILEGSLQSPMPQLQLVALASLAKTQSNRGDKALIKAMAAGHPLIRLEAAHLLCQKKHPQAIAQTESLMYKLPKEVIPLFPQLIACVGDDQSARLLRRFLNDPNEEVRIAAIDTVAKHKRDDFLPQIRALASQHSYMQQEIAAKALGIFHDEISIAKLKKMTQSQYPYVRLSAWNSLDILGDKEALQHIQKMASEDDPFAIHLLGQREGNEDFLVSLMKRSNLQVRVNATIALLEREDPRCIKGLPEILNTDKRDLGFSVISSPGKSLSAWKATPSSSQIFGEEMEAYTLHIQLKEEVLAKARRLNERAFLEIADALLKTRQNELIPELIAQLIDMKTEWTIRLLKKYQQQPGAPLIRQYCNLALYEIKEEGPYAQCLKEWVKGQKNEGLIQFRTPLPWNQRSLHSCYVLTPEETSRLLVESFEALANHQDKEGIEILLEAIQYGNPKNRYALAGLLVRATQ